MVTITLEALFYTKRFYLIIFEALWGLQFPPG